MAIIQRRASSAEPAGAGEVAPRPAPAPPHAPAPQAASGTAATAPASAREIYTLARISNDDNVVCREGNARVRLLLIDAPEMQQDSAGRKTKRALERLAPLGTPLGLETDSRERDQYDRLLAYLYLPDGRMLNEELAREGYAVALVYPPNVRHVERIRGAVEDARRERRGLWATDAFRCAPRDFRAKRCGR